VWPAPPKPAQAPGAAAGETPTDIAAEEAIA
jgi:hypothetical protein